MKNTKIIFAFIVFYIILIFNGLAQNTITGKIVDSKSENPVQFVNVSLLRQSDSVMIAYSSTDEQGNFKMQMIPSGNYRLVAFFVGYENLEQQISVTKDFDLNTLKLNAGTATIGEVVIKSERPLFAVDGEKTLYNSAEDPSVQAGTASDVLQNAPGVSVDVEGNVTLRGTSSVEIWINDKPSNLTSENLKTYLQQMPANSIDHVEVITNPSARYGSKADGIINIVTTTKVKRNQFVSFGANASINPRVSPWISYVWSNDKVSINLYTNFSYSRDKNYGMSDMTIYQEGETEREAVIFEKDSSFNIENHYGTGVHLNIDYEIDSMNSLSFWGGFWPNWSNGSDFSETFRDFYLLDTQTHYTTQTSGKAGAYWGGFGVYYQHKFDNKGHNIALDFTGSSWGYKLDAQSLKDFSSPFAYTRNRHFIGNFGNFDVNAELTYTRPYSENGEISIGYYGDFEYDRNTSQLDTMISSNHWVTDEYRSFKHNDIEAENQIFFTLQHKFGNFTIKPGVRLEHTYISQVFPDMIPDTFMVKKHFFHARPSLHLSYRTESMHNFRLSYSFRSSNPSAENLTLFKTFEEDSYSSGNPFLKSILTHSLEAGWQKYWQKYGSLGVTLYFRAKSRDINNISIPAYHEVFGREVSYSYPVNVGKSTNTGLELNTMYRPNAMFNIRLYANVYHTYLETMYNNALYKNQMWSYSFNLSVWAKLWKRLEINVSGNYSSPTLSLFSVQHPYYGINAGLRADFFDNRLSIFLNANDIFNWNKWGRDQDSPLLESHSTYKFNSRSVSLGFTLRFGKMELEQQARQGGGGNQGTMGR